MIPDAKGLYNGLPHVARQVPYDTLVRVPEGDTMSTSQPPAPTVILADVRYTTTATAAQLANVFHQAGPWGDPAFDPATTTWTLEGTPLHLLPALEAAGIVLDGPGDVQADEAAGGILAPPPPFRTAAEHAAHIRAVRKAAGQARDALTRLDARCARALRAGRPLEGAARTAALRDTQAALAQMQELRRLLVVGNLPDG